MKKVAAATHRATDIALIIAAIGLVVMTLVISWQVFARYVLNASPAWSESLSLLLMLYFILLAAAVGVYEDFHLGLRIVLDHVPLKIRKYLVTTNYSLVAFFGVAMMINGSRLAAYTTDHVIPTLGISRSVAYWPFTTAGLLISVFAIERVIILLFDAED